MIDLRSDTVTQPCSGMRKAMAAAEVGDDVYGEDPTVNRLQQRTAEMLGMQAALFVPSGTQSNLIALLTHCGRGDEYIVGQMAHTYRFEGGGAAALGGIQPQPLDFLPDGSLDLEQVRATVKELDPHFARTRLLCLENTNNGKVITSEYFRKARALCDEKGLKLHLDGARLFNAAVASHTDPTEWGALCDTISVCLSKGLGAPVGSVLCGPSDVIEQARRWRKMVGGGMRQAGVIAAAGLFALDHNVARLSEDHNHARLIAQALEVRFPGSVEQATNMVFVNLPAATLKPFLAHMRANGVMVQRPRWVLHKDVGVDDVAQVIESIRRFRSD
ncbi:MAG: low-specificity L-threonine aldolase [Proteobacteria bacterium]|nr:low-specificity L-threonine aldolase [Pseudomonadota bacterium]